MEELVTCLACGRVGPERQRELHAERCDRVFQAWPRGLRGIDGHHQALLEVGARLQGEREELGRLESRNAELEREAAR